MADRLDPEARSRNLAKIRRADTGPELAVRKALHAAGFRFRPHDPKLPGKPDIVLPQVTGCAPNLVLDLHGVVAQLWPWRIHNANPYG